jgi:hypothetical protein
VSDSGHSERATGCYFDPERAYILDGRGNRDPREDPVCETLHPEACGNQVHPAGGWRCRSVASFIDPRIQMAPRPNGTISRTAVTGDRLTELHSLCRAGRLYDVERWIWEGNPLQVERETEVSERRSPSALQIALEAGNQALSLLLLCNGYDPNLDAGCPLDIAFRSRRWDLVDLLLGWGTDPHRANLSDLFETYNSDLIERFYRLGVDVAAGHELAAALGYHTSNKPLFGFAKRHREHEVKIQKELNIALVHHAGEGNEKGVQLCLWAGADPHLGRHPKPAIERHLKTGQRG